ncbi:MAG TPA: ribonuclease HII [Cellulomonas sp.]
MTDLHDVPVPVPPVAPAAPAARVVRRRTTTPSRTTVPTLRVERELLRDGASALACCDEVGRGALSGPVTVGAVLVTGTTRTAPQGVRDSKLLSPARRVALVPAIQRWAQAWGVGHASPAEIDEHGIIAALRLAGQRALAGLTLTPDRVLLDGNHDYLTAPAQVSLFDLDLEGGPGSAIGSVPAPVLPVTTRIKADMTCAAVAAASILAKTTRDALMLDLAEQHPEYGWHENKGYASPDHIDALRRLGPTAHHRRSWRLPGVDGTTPGPDRG